MALQANTCEPFLSKSKFLMGRQCHKWLWHAINASDQIPVPDAAQRAIFEQGHEVAALARSLFPDGIEVGAGVADLDEPVWTTKQALKLRKPLFEAAFAAEGGYCRVDILVATGEDAWRIVEIKSTTKVEPIHLHDLAFQVFVASRAGLDIQECSVMHLNADYVRQGHIDPGKLFVDADVTSEVLNRYRGVEEELAAMAKVIRRPVCPEIQIGPHCNDPYPCPLQDRCWAFLPEQHVVTLYRGGRKGFQLLADGIAELKSIPAGFPLTANQRIQRKAAMTDTPHVDPPALRAFLSQLEYPVSYLDFETFSTAIPTFDGLTPYQQVPFKFSLHVVRSARAEPEHFGFLADGRIDLRPEFMRRLQAVLPESGSVIVYNAAFEKGRLDECADRLPAFVSWVQSLKRRVVDLLLPFRGFRYYHPDQLGSASMKVVLPALTGRGYDQLEIQEGNTASLEFLRVHFSDVPEAERRKVRQQLERYCGLDTEGMIWIVDALQRLVP